MLMTEIYQKAFHASSVFAGISRPLKRHCERVLVQKQARKASYAFGAMCWVLKTTFNNGS
ncbi:hypothetical protein CLAFUR0_03735 [Fulvia fulva]|nr:hypothetical protein CLAFUR0_03735 [Fulvia fulva]